MNNNAVDADLKRDNENIRYAMEYMNIIPEDIDQFIVGGYGDLMNNYFVNYKESYNYATQTPAVQKQIDAFQQYMSGVINQFQTEHPSSSGEDYKQYDQALNEFLLKKRQRNETRTSGSRAIKIEDEMKDNQEGRRQSAVNERYVKKSDRVNFARGLNIKPDVDVPDSNSSYKFFLFS